MTVAPETSTVKRALSAHAAIGLLAGALLYLVSLSGTLLVFYEEWQRVEQPSPPQMTAISPEAVQRGMEAMLARETGKTPTTHFYVDMPLQELPTTRVITDTESFHIDSAGRLSGTEDIEWSNFLYALHYTLNITAGNGLIGITLVGILGMLMLALAITGVVAHPKIFRDAFRLRTRHTGGVAMADWHNRLSVWTLPFGIALSLTGAVIGLSSVSAYAAAALFYKGDVEALYATIFGEEGEPNEAKAALPDVAAPLRYMAANYPDVRVTYVTVHEPGTAGQQVQIVAEHPRRLIFGEYYMFDANGNFTGTAGLSDGELGSQAAASNYSLHFGNYGGLTVKIIYALFGLALTAVVATGSYIWLGKRRRRGIVEPRLHAAWSAVVWGSPLMLALTLVARFAIGHQAPFAAIFWIGLAILIVAALVAPSRMPRALRLQPAA
ncbi:PepSY domain-containing protein [Croceibacterium sp. LX-88]|uniref:PepSY domain-containing protein n=1 Tax=Croceibacterium selenioxidans TaxID=2838833 RepID=A0ABS5VZN1_9SPHN|nr:PepSY-associated TM helix domain-containing protein [Croceibacterium selenioxidans]MBT2132966.1 PepSY domain-containing protein [Croceibacterium selenioxidans]